MNGKKYTKNDLDKLLKLKNNKFLKDNSEEKRYKIFRSVDPYSDDLNDTLNYYDIFRYIMVAGMINPFDPEALVGSTYTCNFSGKYKYWEDGETFESELKEDESLILRPNSITFLEIEPMFRIPEYLILRFNLKVQHVYKGLLLGTGPIVDPGFSGYLNIPLHNLTSNEYEIKKNAPLICIEFTKLSKYKDHDFNTNHKYFNIIKNLDFNSVKPYYGNFTEKKRDVSFYIKKALDDDLRFMKKGPTSLPNFYSVGSSIPESIKQSEKNATEAKKSAKSAENKVKLILGIGIIGIVGILVSLLIMLKNIEESFNSRIDNIYDKIIFFDDYKKIKESIEELKQNELLDMPLLDQQTETNEDHKEG